MGSHTISDADSSAHVMNSIRRLVRALRLFDREAERRIGLSGAQVFILRNLSTGEGISINELAARTCTDQSSVSVVVQKLVDRKLVRRSRADADKRRVELTITPAGRQRLESAPTTAQERMISALHEMPATTRRQLATHLHELVRNLGLDQEPATLFFEDSSQKRSAVKRSARGA